MNIILIGCILLLYSVFGCVADSGYTPSSSGNVDFVVTIIIASVAGGMVIMVMVILFIRCICIKCKKNEVRQIRPRGPPSYEDSRRVYRLPPPPPYAPRDYPSHPPPSYESHLPLPGVAD